MFKRSKYRERERERETCCIEYLSTEHSLSRKCSDSTKPAPSTPFIQAGNLYTKKNSLKKTRTRQRKHPRKKELAQEKTLMVKKIRSRPRKRSRKKLIFKLEENYQSILHSEIICRYQQLKLLESFLYFLDRELCLLGFLVTFLAVIVFS